MGISSHSSSAFIRSPPHLFSSRFSQVSERRMATENEELDSIGGGIYSSSGNHRRDEEQMKEE